MLIARKQALIPQTIESFVEPRHIPGILRVCEKPVLALYEKEQLVKAQLSFDDGSGFWFSNQNSHQTLGIRNNAQDEIAYTFWCQSLCEVLINGKQIRAYEHCTPNEIEQLRLCILHIELLIIEMTRGKSSGHFFTFFQ